MDRGEAGFPSLDLPIAPRGEKRGHQEDRTPGGDAERPLVVVDTPGHDDPSGAELDSKEAREARLELEAELREHRQLI